ncbi:MAG: cysteine hydrolase [Rubellimicrobium sp.]|nr:cysteine hydrolase [Rubellimicrobium sp.]
MLDPARAAVIVVDMINDFCTPGGAMVLPDSDVLIAPQLQVIAAARAAGVPVIWVHDVHRTNVRHDREWQKRTPHGHEGTPAVEIIAALGARADEIHVTKRRYSAFFGTDMDLTLRDLGVGQVIVMGVVTNICVRSTVHDAFFLGYEIAVPQDCCAATGPREQDSSLYDIATHFGTVTTAAAVVGALSAGGGAIAAVTMAEQGGPTPA